MSNTSIPYKMINIITPPAVNDGGNLVINNFKTIANYIEALSGYVDNNNTKIDSTINTEITNRQNSDNNLQSQLVTISSHPLVNQNLSSFVLSNTISGARSALGPYSDALVTTNGSSVNRTLKDHFSDYLNVKDFGAVGDGITDDTAAFATLASISSPGSNVYIFVPPGIYKLTAALTFVNIGVYIRGGGQRQSILRFYGCHGIIHQGDYTLDINNIGLETNSNGTYTGIQYGISTPVLTQDSFRATCVNLWGVTYGTNYWNTGIAIADSGNTWFDRVTIIGQYAVSPFYAGKGIRFLSTVGKPSTGHHFTRCTFNDLNTGVEIIASNYPSIEGIRFHYCGFVSVNTGISFNAGSSGYQPPLLTIFECHIDLAANGTNPIGIYCNTISQIHISGCDLYAYAPDSVLIWLSNCNQSCIHGNHFIGGSFSNMSAILLENGTTFTDINSNVIAGGFSNGIYLLNTALDYNRDINNRFAGVTNEVADGTGKFIRLGKSKVRTKLTSTQAITSSTPTSIIWNTTDENIGTSWLVGTPTRISVPSEVRCINFSATIRFESNGNGYRQVVLKKNGSFALGLPIQTISAVSGQPTDISISSGTLDVVSGDYFEVEVVQSSGITLNVDNTVTYAIMSIIRSE